MNAQPDLFWQPSAGELVRFNSGGRLRRGSYQPGAMRVIKDCGDGVFTCTPVGPVSERTLPNGRVRFVGPTHQTYCSVEELEPHIELQQGQLL